jgi:hypothetical protein
LRESPRSQRDPDPFDKIRLGRLRLAAERQKQIRELGKARVAPGERLKVPDGELERENGAVCE